MIDRTAGLWQFGRLWEYGVLEKAFGMETTKGRKPIPDKNSPFWKARRLFFSYRFAEVLAMENELKPLIGTVPEVWGLLGHSRIRAVQDAKPFAADIAAWKKGLAFFQQGFELFPENKLLEYDCMRARAVLEGRGMLDYAVPRTWIERYLSAYFWLFLIYSPLIPDVKRDASGVFASAALPQKLISLSKSITDDAADDMQKREALLLACDLLEFSGDTEGIIGLLESGEAPGWKKDPEFLSRKGLAYLDDENRSFVEIEPDAAKVFVNALEIQPLNPVRYEHLVRLYLALEEYDIARTYLEMGVSRDFGRGQDHEGLLFAGGILHVAQSLNGGKDDPGLLEGLKQLEKSVELNPYRWESYDSISTAYAAIGDYQKALRSIRRLLKLKPWKKDYFLGLGELLLRTPMDSEGYETRVKRLREAVIAIAIYRKTDTDSEYAASLALSALAKLYSAEITRGVENSDARESSDVNAAELQKEIDEYIGGLDESVLASADFLAYTGFELYINHVPEAGRSFLAKALSINPAHPYALQSYGVVLEESGLIENDQVILRDAYQHFKRAWEYEKDPFTKGRYLLYLVDFLPSADLGHLVSGFLAKGLDAELPVPELYERMADEHMQNGRDDLAFGVLEKGRELFPDNPELTFRLSKELSRDGRYVQGIQLLEGLISRHAQDAAYWNQLGISYVDWANGLVKPEDAEAGYLKGRQAFEKAVELDPLSPLFLGNLGDACRLLGEFNKAEEYLQQAIDLYPGDGFYYYVLAKVFWEKGLGEPEEQHEQFVRTSEELFTKAQALDPDTVRYYQDMGDMYYHYGYFVDAIDLYRKALEIDNESPALYDSVGLCHYQLREFPEAIEWFTLGLDYARDPGEILNSIGLCYYEQGMFEEAQRFFKRASDTDPSNSVFLDNVFLAQYKLMGFSENWDG